MSLFKKKTETEKREREEIKNIKEQAREDRKDAREDARDERKDAREEAREERKDAREDKRDAMTEIREAGLKGKDKRDAKGEVRDEKRDTIDQANKEKRDDIKDANAGKRTDVDAIKVGEIADIAQVSGGAGVVFRRKLAIELLKFAQKTEDDALGSSSSASESSGDDQGVSTLNGSPVNGVVAIKRKNWKSDTEAYVGRSEAGDVVVGFRSSETELFGKTGALKDWVLTDFRSHRMPYPPAPGSWPNQRWVHTGFWEAYELVRNELIAEVSRQANLTPKASTIFVTGFSLGGALALLAAMDLGDAMKATPVELVTFAAPRVGDESLNKLLAERVRRSLLIAFGGDPFVHLPPIGPNSPVTFKHPIGVDVAGLHIGFANPLPAVGQQYRSADRLEYIDRNGVARDGFPPAQIALNFLDHNHARYLAALGGGGSSTDTTRFTQTVTT